MARSGNRKQQRKLNYLLIFEKFIEIILLISLILLILKTYKRPDIV